MGNHVSISNRGVLSWNCGNGQICFHTLYFCVYFSEMVFLVNFVFHNGAVTPFQNFIDFLLMNEMKYLSYLWVLFVVLDSDRHTVIDLSYFTGYHRVVAPPDNSFYFLTFLSSQWQWQYSNRKYTDKVLNQSINFDKFCGKIKIFFLKIWAVYVLGQWISICSLCF